MSIEDPNTNDDFDMEAAVSSLSSDLFGQGDEGSKVEVVEVGQEGDGEPVSPTPGEAIEPPAQEGTETANTEEVQALGAPNTWTKEGLAEWAKIPPAAQQEILKREQDFFKGIEGYKEKADLGGRYDAVVEPFRATLAAEQVDPVQLFQSFSSNHYLLSRGTPEQKIQVAANLVRSYGLDLNAIAVALGTAEQPVDPTIKSLQDEVAALRSSDQQRQNQIIEQKRAELTSEINTFASDPAHPHFPKVINHMSDLLKANPNMGLKAAYDTAVMANPETRQLEIDRLTSEKMEAAKAAEREKVEAAKKAKGANVRTLQTERNGTVPSNKSWEETLEETAKDIASRA